MRIGGIINFIANQSSAKINEHLKTKGISHGEARVIHLLYHQDGLLQEKLTKLLLIDQAFENVSNKMVNGLNLLEKEQLNQMLHTLAKNMEEFYE